MEWAVSQHQTGAGDRQGIEVGVRYEIAEVRNLDYLVADIVEAVRKLDVEDTVE